MLNNPIIFTDLDGTLLDHHTYSFTAALPMLEKLQALAIPIIPNTSKTFAELSSIMQAINIKGPFIVENGAAVYIPVGYFDQQPAHTSEKRGFWVKEFSAQRQQWITLVEAAKSQFAHQFDHFANMSVQQIVDATGLTLEQAKLAANREFGEPVLWLGDEPGKQQFINHLIKHGATPLSGGRFLHVSGQCDKGQALVWLQHQFSDLKGLSNTHTIALGDGQNDIAMLEAADIAVRILSPVNPLPKLSKHTHVLTSDEFGPKGWSSSLETIIFNS